MATSAKRARLLDRPCNTSSIVRDSLISKETDIPDFESVLREAKSVQSSEDFPTVLASMLHDARDAAERSDHRTLVDLIIRATAFLTKPKPGGDAGFGVTPSMVSELRTVKRTLIMCLESVEFAAIDMTSTCVAALEYARSLVDDIVFSPSAKGGQQWITLRELVVNALAARNDKHHQPCNPSTALPSILDLAKELEFVESLGTVIARQEHLASILHDARIAVENSDDIALQKLLVRAVSFLKAPRSGGDGGPGVSTEVVAEVRAVKRALIICLEALDFGKPDTLASCYKALHHVQGLINGIPLSPKAKGGQQWITIRDLIDQALGGATLQVRSEVFLRNAHQAPMVDDLTEKQHDVCTHTPLIDRDRNGVPGIIVVVIHRVMEQLGDATLSEILRHAGYNGEVWDGIDLRLLNRYPTEHWWICNQREPWMNFIAASLKKICHNTGLKRRGAGRKNKRQIVWKWQGKLD